MAKVFIVYYSSTGNTEKMAEFVAEGARKSGAEVAVRKVQEAAIEDLEIADAVILGSPTYYGHSAGKMRNFIDKSVVLHGRLEGKVGGAFSSSHNIGGGNETAVRDLLDALLVHGMIIQGASNGDHYGPVSLGIPDRRVENQCRQLGERVARLAERTASEE